MTRTTLPPVKPPVSSEKKRGLRHASHPGLAFDADKNASKQPPNRVLEKSMMGMALTFILGVVALTLVPKAYSGLTITLISGMAMWFMFRKP